jgi:hypothetical protein
LGICWDSAGNEGFFPPVNDWDEIELGIGWDRKKIRKVYLRIKHSK